MRAPIQSTPSTRTHLNRPSLVWLPILLASVAWAFIWVFWIPTRFGPLAFVGLLVIVWVAARRAFPMHPPPWALFQKVGSLFVGAGIALLVTSHWISGQVPTSNENILWSPLLVVLASFCFLIGSWWLLQTPSKRNPTPTR